jgi:hypothetical protein
MRRQSTRGWHDAGRERSFSIAIANSQPLANANANAYAYSRLWPLSSVGELWSSGPVDGDEIVLVATQT